MEFSDERAESTLIKAGSRYLATLSAAGAELIVNVQLEAGRLTLEPVRSALPGESNARVTRLAQRVVDGDAILGKRVRSGSAVSIAIPDERPKPAGASRVVVPDDALRLRQSVGALIRPMLSTEHFGEPLLPFQRSGVAWLLRRRRGLLADDMGLGKTVQAIAALRRLVRRGLVGCAIVVVPRSLIANWEQEIEKWAPELSRITVLPGARDREEVWQSLVGRSHVLLTNYEQLRGPPGALLDARLDLMICDEAHRIRNEEAQIAVGVRRLTLDRLWALSGTPLERDTRDVATLMSFVEPREFRPADARDHPVLLRARIRPFVLRRRKEDVLDALPEVVVRREIIELSDEQAASYRQAIMEFALRDDDNYLALLTQLRSICDVDPETGVSSKLDRILELLSHIIELKEKAVVFSHFLEPLRQLDRRLSIMEISGSSLMLTGDLPGEQRDVIVNAFRQSEDHPVLLASSRVAGEGLTLVEANHAVFVNEWWNPSANEQARDRLIRIGQGRTVFVYLFTCARTIEENLVRILEEKQLVFSDLIEGVGEAVTGQVVRVLQDEVRTLRS